MAISSKDIETLWGRYQSEGVSKVSTQFRAINKVCTFAALQSKCKRKQNNARLFYVECNLSYESALNQMCGPN